MRYNVICKSIMSAAAFALLVGCGDGSGSSTPVVTQSPPPPPPPPPPNQAPTIDSPSEVSLPENSTDIFYTFETSDPDGDAITRTELLMSEDAVFFDFNVETGELAPISAFDFEMPEDANDDNIYDLTFEVEDSQGAVTSFALTVTVDNVSDPMAFNLQAGVPPSQNFDLLDWKLDTPFNDEGELEGIQAGVSEDELDDGYEHPIYFHTGPDGGLVMRSPVMGAKTSANTSFTRTELREMLRRGDRSIKTRGAGDRPNLNNWALSSAPESALETAGGVDGRLRVSMSVNSVTTTGERHQIGRLIIGQIHAKDDEPIRLYYRKLPGNTHGSIYACHEIAGGDDINFEIIGSDSSIASNPSNGFLLDEIFTYEIITRGNLLDVIISQNGQVRGEQTIDMTNSDYDVDDDFMYFKAGAYHVNNSADEDEYAQVTIYELENSHEGYDF